MSKLKQIVLVADDSYISRMLIVNALNDYIVLEADNGKSALETILRYRSQLSAVCLDLYMPQMSGLEILSEIKKHNLIDKLAIFIITAERDYNILSKAYELGAADVVEKPIIPFFFKNRLLNAIFEKSIYKRQSRQLYEQNFQLNSMRGAMTESLATAIEFRSCESGEHVKRIRRITEILLNELIRYNRYPELNYDQISFIAEAAVLHDVGKIAIADAILDKPGRLTSEEFEIIKTHSQRGVELLSNISQLAATPLFGYAKEICNYHHERWDGRGYPKGLKGDEIPVWAQVVGLADCYDALRSVRVYKKPYEHKQTLKMISDGECGVFQPLLLSCLLSCEKDIRDLYERFSVAIKKEEPKEYKEGNLEKLSTGLVWINKDYSEEDLEIIRNHRRLFQEVTDFLPVPAVFFGVRNKVIFTCGNDEFYSLLGYTAEQYWKEVNSPFDLIISGEREQVLSKITELSQSKENFLVDVAKHKRRDGSEFLSRNRIKIISVEKNGMIICSQIMEVINNSNI